MKKAILMTSVFSALVATSAFALPNANTPWDQILADPSVQVSNTTVLDARLGSVFNVCVNGDMLSTIKPVQTATGCTTEHNGSTRNGVTTTCVGQNFEMVTMPIHQVQATCLQGGMTGPAGRGTFECTQPGYTQTTLPTTYMMTVGVGHYNSNGRGSSFSFQPLFTKAYTLPNCMGTTQAPPAPPTQPVSAD